LNFAVKKLAERVKLPLMQMNKMGSIVDIKLYRKHWRHPHMLINSKHRLSLKMLRTFVAAMAVYD
jgi:hypothetical protein